MLVTKVGCCCTRLVAAGAMLTRGLVMVRPWVGCEVTMGLSCGWVDMGSCLMMMGLLTPAGWRLVVVAAMPGCRLAGSVGWTIITKFWRLLSSWVWLLTPPTVAISWPWGLRRGMGQELY